MTEQESSQFDAEEEHADLSHADLKSVLPTEAGEHDEVEERDTILRGFLGLFVVPLLVVLASVGVFLGFGWLAYDGSEVGDFVDDLSHGWKPRRTQAAYELSKILLADPEALADDPTAQLKVRTLFAESKDHAIRRYLALVLGYTHDEASVPALLDAAESEDAHLRIYALWALGAMGDNRGEQRLIAALSDQDPGIRKIAAHALAEIETPAAVEALGTVLEDATADVRWNAAVALAAQGHDQGMPVLLEMVDRERVAAVPDITPAQIEEVILSGIDALGRLGGPQALEALGALESDPSLAVRDAARRAAQAESS